MPAQIVIPGANVGREVEPFTFGQDGRGIRFSVAMSETNRGEEITSWYKVTCFGRMADTAQTLIDDGKLVTGSRVVVIGSFTPRPYVTRNGEDRMSLDIIANTIEVISYPKRQQQQAPLGQDDYADYYDDAAEEDAPPF